MKKGFISFLSACVISIGITGNASAEELIVKEGDTLWDIAEQKNVSVEELKDWNELTSDLIQPNDSLTIQEYYKILEGDSLWDIAKDHDITISELQEWNKIESDIIQPGDELIVDHKNNSNKEQSSQPKTEQKEAAKVKTEQKETATVKAAATNSASTEPTEKSTGKEITVQATAYTANCEGCSGTTKTGIDLHANPDKKVIAVDPDVIPLGSKVHVEGYGEAIAGDIGGGINGHEIDVFIPSESKAKEWGRQEVQVKILN
jgi:N-acetylmuramoyl-L-alanine amidase